MMIGSHLDPTVHAPSWTFQDDLTVEISSSPNGDDDEEEEYFVSDPKSYACKNIFMMFEFKVRKCVRGGAGGSHDWTDCPFAHPGEKARRRDPRKYLYSGTTCSEFKRSGFCIKGDLCEFAHGIFECWLHPSRYRTQPCKDGIDCRRKVCFFAHTPDQLRVPSPTSAIRTESYDGSPLRLALESVFSPYNSPPLSPASNSLNRHIGLNSVNEMVSSLRQLQLNKIKSFPSSWGVHLGLDLGSPRLSMARARPVFSSLPSTPTGVIRAIDMWDKSRYAESSPIMEPVESGRDLRAEMFEKLSRENPLGWVESVSSVHLDVGWDSQVVGMK